MQEENTTGVIFASGLRQAMKDQSLTQVDLAERIGVTQAAVSKWINGTVPKGDQLFAIAKALGLNIEWLLLGKNPKSKALGDALAIMLGVAAVISKTSKDTNEVALEHISDAMCLLEADFLDLQALPSEDGSHLPTADLVAFHEYFQASDYETCLAALEHLNPIYKLTPGSVDFFARILERLVEISTDPEAARSVRTRANEISQSADSRKRRLSENPIMGKRGAAPAPGE